MSEPISPQVLAAGELHVLGQLHGASNASLLCEVEGCRCVYKPMRGERPLWDFPEGSLGRREIATSILDGLLGWNLVPRTVWRDTGPLGPGMCQEWKDHAVGDQPIELLDPTEVPPGWRVVIEGETHRGEPIVLAHEDSPRLRRIALLDIVANNADRKGGHVLRSTDGLSWAIDHGVTFHAEPKLRTVLWGWAGENLSDDELGDVSRLGGLLSEDREPTAELRRCLSRTEFDAMSDRVADLMRDGRFPDPPHDRSALPWPPM